MEELLTRIELTIKDFNDEMKNLCDELITKEKERQQLMEMLKTTEGMPAPVPTQDISSKIEPETSETVKSSINEELDEDAPKWEKKLAKLEKK